MTVLTLAVYGQMIDHTFISFDDDDYITGNPVVREGLTLNGLLWSFSSPHVYNWHPLTWLSHMIDIQIFGLNAGGHHLMSLLFHIANTLLLFLVLRGMTGALWRSAAVAALFALHPLHVESVAWAAERKDVLSTFFWILTLWLYLRYAKNPDLRHYWPVFLCYATGLLAKQMAVTLPFVLLLLDYWPLGRLSSAPVSASAPIRNETFSPDKPGKQRPQPVAQPISPARTTDPVPSTVARSRLAPLILEKLPLFALAAAASVIIYLVQKETGIVKSTVEFPFSARMGNAFVAYVTYLLKTICPLDLAVFYPHPGTTLPLWKGAGAALLTVAITILVLLGRRPYLAVGWFWYLGTLVPVIGIVQVGIQGMADRYTYVPLIGVFIILSWGIPELVAKWRIPKVALMVTTAASLTALTVLTGFQVGTWRNNITLYGHATRVSTGNYWAENNLGLALLKDEQRDDEALTHFLEAIRLQPGCADAYLSIGAIQAKRGSLDEAVANFTRVLDLKPTYPEALRNLFQALLQQGKFEEAAARLQDLRRIKPDDSETWFLTGRFQVKRGNPTEAESAYTKAIRLRPDYPEAHNSLGILLARQGRFEEAISHFREALRIRPDYPEARRNLETALGESRANR